MSYFAAHFKSNLLAYISLDPIFMTNEHFYHVLDEDFVHKIFLMYSEAGIYLKLFDSIKKNSFEYFIKENRIYRTPKEYVDDVVSFDNLGIGNFYGIFKVYFFVCSIVFGIHLTINCMLSRRRRIEFIIYLNFQRFVNVKNRIISFVSKTLSLE